MLPRWNIIAIAKLTSIAGREGIVNKPTSSDRPKRASPAELDQATDQLGQALRRAFPLPESGAFSDLLAALDAGREMRP